MASMFSSCRSLSSVVPYDPPNQLKITDLPEVLDLLRNHGYLGTSYDILGFCLGLSSTTLDVIRNNNSDDTESCLRECLKAWLLKADNLEWTKGNPTIYSLVSALRELGENGVADGIDMAMHPACKIVARYTSNQSLLSVLPQLDIYLYEAKLIKGAIIPRNRQGEALLGRIKEAICVDYRKLEAFADILCQDPVTAEIGNAIMRDYRELDGSDDSIEECVDNKNVEMLMHVIYFSVSITSEFKLMRLKFGQTFFKVGSIMMNSPQSPTLDNIKYVLGIYNSALRPQLVHFKDIRDVLQLVSDNSSLDDISMLEYLVDESNLEEAQVVIKKYKEAIEEFKEIKFIPFLREKFPIAVPFEFTIIVDEDADKSMLNDVKRLSSAIFEKAPQHIRINVIRGFSLQSKDTTLTTEVRAGTTESVSHSYQEEEEDEKDEEKQLEEEKELHEEEKLIYEQVIKESEEKIATLIELQEKVTGGLKQTQIKAEEYEESRSELQNEIQKIKNKRGIFQKLQSEIQKFKNESKTFQKQRKALILENERLRSLLKDHNVPVQQKEETEILQETETVHTCTYISKVILEPVEDDSYHIGQCLEVKESVLTEIKEMTPVDSRLTHVLETWCHEKDRTMTELKESLKRIDRDDILEGLHELPTGQYTMNNDEEYDINVKDSKEFENHIEAENKEIKTTQT
uniref:Death domain-containing protein n=1 Tax=Amphimedon queenslandica TaxID=400682 RepID=A0A1X7TGC4_AMPQE